MRISDWSSDVCSSDLDAKHQAEPVLGLRLQRAADPGRRRPAVPGFRTAAVAHAGRRCNGAFQRVRGDQRSPTAHFRAAAERSGAGCGVCSPRSGDRSEEHTSELQSLMRISYAVFCLKKKNTRTDKLPTYSNFHYT